MTNELAIRNTQIIHSFDDAQRAATAMAKSGFFQDSREAAQALVKVLAGQELGFGPFASMTGVFIIQGRPSIGANLMASAVKGSGKYNYRVKTNTDTLCEIEFFEAGKSIGVSTFSIEDARKAQTKNLDKFPRNMLFARAMSNGVRWFCPDAFNGNAVYTPEELGADVDVDGNVIQGSFKVEPISSEPEKPVVTQPVGDRPYSPNELKNRLLLIENTFTGKTCTENERTSVRINLATMAGGEEQYHTLLEWLTGFNHIKDVPDTKVLALKKWIHSTKQQDDTWLPDENSIKEAKSAYDEALKDLGQQQLPLS